MNRLDRELTLELPQTMNLDTFAAHFFNSGASDSDHINSATVRSVNIFNRTAKAAINSIAATPHITRSAVGNQFFQKVGETLFGFGIGGDPDSLASVHHSIRVSNSEISSGGPNMDLLRNHIVIDSADFGTSATTTANEMQQQLEYDKFMNEIWIGIVMTLIIISMVFCICSCFLYHQFRQWKRNYRHNLQQTTDIESAKLNPDTDDPVPEYTLVSGLPSYEAALELMQNSSCHNNGNGFANNSNNTTGNNGSCLIVYPSALFGAFMVNEKESLLMSKSQEQLSDATIPQSPSIGGGVVGVTSALTSQTPITTTTTTSSTTTTIPMTENVKCQNVPRLTLQQYSIPSYEEAIGYQPQQQQQQQFNGNDTSDTTCVIKTPAPPPTWSDDEKKKDEK